MSLKVPEEKPKTSAKATGPPVKKISLFEQKMLDKKAADEAAREAARKNPKPDPYKAKAFESKSDPPLIS